jgi:predicted HicB family RNase H-like nuclease
MSQKKKETSGDFLLRLTKEERKKIKLISVQRNTTMQSLIRHILNNNLEISDL